MNRVAARTLDVTFLARVATPGAGFQLVLALIAHQCRSGAIDLAKLRVAGLPGVPYAPRAALLTTARRRFASPAPRLVSMWIAPDLADASELNGLEADAFFFRWALHGTQVVQDTVQSRLGRIATMIAAGRLVAIQLEINAASDLRRYVALLRWAARHREFASEYCRWEIAVAGGADLFFAPSPCRRADAGALGTIAGVKRQLADMGIAADGGEVSPLPCPAQRPETYLFDDGGPQPWCARCPAVSYTGVKAS